MFSQMISQSNVTSLILHEVSIKFMASKRKIISVSFLDQSWQNCPQLMGAAKNNFEV